MIREMQEKEDNQLNEDRYTDRDALIEIARNIKENKDEDPVAVLNWIMSFVTRRISVKHRMQSNLQKPTNEEDNKIKLNLLNQLKENEEISSLSKKD